MSFNVTNQAPQEEKDDSQIKADALLQTIITKTPEEIDQYLKDNLSALFTMTDKEVDSYVTTLTNLSKVQGALDSIAKDLKFLIKVNALMMKVIVILTRKMI